MGPFDVELRKYMKPEPISIHREERIHVADERMREHGISGLPVVDDEGRAVGVLTRSDLLKLETVPAVTGGRERKLMLPDHVVGRVMTRQVISLPAHATLKDAAHTMQEERIHRVLVVEDEKLVGVITAWDLVRRAAEAKAECPIEALMTPSVITVDQSTSIDDAMEAMRRSDVHGVVVVHDGWPVGVFAQAEALQAELLPTADRVQHWTSASLLTMPPSMPCHHAATHAVATGARYIVVVHEGQILGLLTPANFAALGQLDSG